MSHYHQRPGCHPSPQRIPAGVERVELMTGGRGWVEHGGEWVEVLPGHLIWQVAGDQTIARSDFEHPYRCLSVAFAVGRRRPLRPVSRITEWPDLVAVREFTEELVRMRVEELIPEQALAVYAYSRLHVQALKGEKSSEEARLPPILRRALEAIEKGYRGKAGIGELAEASGCSEAYLHELCKRHLGTSPHQMILDRRLKEAARRLTSTSQPIKRIAAELGFSHSAAFCHAFKRHAGYTPAEYRRRAHVLS